MPTCPGCRRRVAHADLPTHERYCPHVWAESAERGRRTHGWSGHLAASMRQLDARAADAASVARLSRRVERLEALVEDGE